MFLLGTFLTLLAGVDRTVGICSDYQTQVSDLMCSWQSVRGKTSFHFHSPWSFVLIVLANVIRDKIYIDGGSLWNEQYGKSEMWREKHWSNADNFRIYSDNCTGRNPASKRPQA